MIKITKPTAAELNAIDMVPVKQAILTRSDDKKYITMGAGREHYRLLYWFGKTYAYYALELGTYRGHSALAIAMGGANVNSFDIESHLDILIVEEYDLYFHIKENGHLEINDKVKLVFLDTYHDGTYERVVLNHLRDIKWKGILVMDDIHLNDEMKAVWSEITERKEDWSDIGHWSGTGIVFFE
jgi:predicted O-methyltransferase YrrM